MAADASTFAELLGWRRTGRIAMPTQAKNGLIENW